MVIGPPLVAAGFIATSTALAFVGALVVVGAAVSLGLFAAATFRDRAAWTTDAGWHRLTSWSLVAGVGWFVVATVLGAMSIWLGGATADGWRLSPLIVPLGVGWVGQVLLGASAHLIPAVGPGSPERHAQQRRTLGMASATRLMTLNASVAAAALGLAADNSPLTLAGMAGIVVAGVAALALAAAALLVPDPRAARLAP
jgi:nitrite reductase (NO-forming)